MPKHKIEDATDTKKKSTSALFPEDVFKRPGEYGDPTRKNGLANGFVIVHHPQLNGQRIFICSRSFVKGLMAEYEIPKTNHVSLIDIQEESLAADHGLKIFRTRLQKLNGITKNDILFNCARGRNRSPVAALIYMVDRGIPYQEAYYALTAAMRVRFPNFELNPYGNYTASLTQLASNSEKIESIKALKRRGFSL